MKQNFTKQLFELCVNVLLSLLSINQCLKRGNVLDFNLCHVCWLRGFSFTGLFCLTKVVSLLMTTDVLF